MEELKDQRFVETKENSMIDETGKRKAIKQYISEKGEILSYIPQSWGMIGDQWECLLKDNSGSENKYITLYARAVSGKYVVTSKFDKTEFVRNSNAVKSNYENLMPSNDNTKKLQQWQLERLCILVYLDDILLGLSEKNLGDLVEKMITNIKNSTDKLPAEMNKEEWKNVLSKIQGDSSLVNLKIVNIQEVTKETNAVLPGQRAVCFLDEGNNAYIIFRGTHGSAEWMDNAHGMVEADTKQQVAALNYVKEMHNALKPNYLAVAGHSKGGNKAQYAAIAAPSGMVQYCLSVDGQGFSASFLEKYQDNIKKRSYIKRIAEHRDFVNCLGFYIDYEKNCASPPTDFFRGYRGYTQKDNLFGYPLPMFHCPDALRGNAGSVLPKSGAGQIPRLVNSILVSFLNDRFFTLEQKKKTAEYFCSLLTQDQKENAFETKAILILAIVVLNLLTKDNEFAENLENLLLLEGNVFLAFAKRKKTSKNEEAYIAEEMLNWIIKFEDTLSLKNKEIEEFGNLNILDPDLDLDLALLLIKIMPLTAKSVLKVINSFIHLYYRCMETGVDILNTIALLIFLIYNICSIASNKIVSNIIIPKGKEKELEQIKNNMIATLTKIAEGNKTEDKEAILKNLEALLVIFENRDSESF